MLKATIRFQLEAGAPTTVGTDLEAPTLGELADLARATVITGRPDDADERAYGDREAGVIHAEAYHQREEGGDFILTRCNAKDARRAHLADALAAMMRDPTIDGLRVYHGGRLLTRAEYEAARPSP